MHGQNDVVPEAKLILREFWGSKRSFVPQRGKIVRENSRRFRTLLSRRRPTQKWPRVYYCTLVFVLVTMGTGWAQSSSDQASTDGAQDMDAQPDSEPSLIPQPDETYPNAGQDTSSTDIPESRSSFVQFGVHASGGIDSNPTGSLGSSQVTSVEHFAGSGGLLKLWHRSETAIDYIGGGTLYGGNGNLGNYDQQQLSANERISWRKGLLTLTDSFRYFGEGDFGSPSYGSGNSFSNGSESASASDAQTTDVVHQAYSTNTSAAEIVEALSARSSGKVAVGYSLSDYFGNNESLFDSRQVSVQAGYDHQFRRLEGIEVVYGFQSLAFPDSKVGRLTANFVKLVYQRGITGRMRLILGGGPELITTGGGITQSTREITYTAQASLLYHWKTSDLSLAYNRLVTAGSDVFAGAESDIVSMSLHHSFSRSWKATLDGGFNRSKEVGLNSSVLPDSSYEYSFVGAAIQRQISRSISSFASYQFNNETFGSCIVATGCNLIVRRHTALIGLDWSFRPMRLD